jgi:hypothetical protein
LGIKIKSFKIPLNVGLMIDLNEKEVIDLFTNDKRLINVLEEPCKTKMQEYMSQISKGLFETSMEVYIRGKGFPETRSCYELAKRIAEVYSTLKSFNSKAAYQREIGKELSQYSWEQIHYALQRLHFTDVALKDPDVGCYYDSRGESWGFCYFFVEEGSTLSKEKMIRRNEAMLRAIKTQ